MTFIDWSDPEEMFGLLCEYVADERGDAGSDPARGRFLTELGEELEDLSEQFGELTHDEVIDRLRTIHRSQPAEFTDDSVLSHVRDCIEELERIRKDETA